jgi:hypothetical protein
MLMLSTEILGSFNSALDKLTGYERRQYAAELCEIHFAGSARKMESVLKVSRAMVNLGLHERRTGIRCIDNYKARGAKKKKYFAQN